MLRRNFASAPRCLCLRAGDADQRQAHAVGIEEGEHGLAEALGQRLMLHALLDKPMRPVADRCRRYREGRGLRQAETAATGGSMLPRKERQNCPGASCLVAIIEVIGAGIIEVHRLLDKAQPQRARVEVEISGRLARYRGYVMDASHRSPLSPPEAGGGVRKISRGYWVEGSRWQSDPARARPICTFTGA